MGLDMNSLPDEFRINKYFELRFRNNETVIYVNNKEFKQCKYLMLSFNKYKNYGKINCIDEAQQFLDSSLEDDLDNPYRKNHDFEISPKEIFWGHCSNMQAWEENDYDTRLLHSNLAFPLLRKLSEDSQKAKNCFIEEIIHRLNDGYGPVQEFLFEEYKGYIFNLPAEFSDSIIGKKLKVKEIFFDGLAKIHYEDKSIKRIPDWVFDVEPLEVLKLPNNKFVSVPDNIKKLKNLRVLHLGADETENLPESLGGLGKLEKLSLQQNKLTRLPENLEGLKQLKRMYLGWNRIKSLPESMGELKNLEYLSVESNILEGLPESLEELGKLKYLNLEKNKIRNEDIGHIQKELPDCHIFY